MKVLGVILLFFAINDLITGGFVFSERLIIQLLFLFAGISCFLYRKKGGGM